MLYVTHTAQPRLNLSWGRGGLNNAKVCPEGGGVFKDDCPEGGGVSKSICPEGGGGQKILPPTPPPGQFMEQPLAKLSQGIGLHAQLHFLSFERFLAAF